MTNITRRSFLKGAAAGAATLAATSLTGVAMAEETEAGHYGIIGPEDFAESVVELAPITEFVDEKTYDIVVVGAGTAGLPAVMTALEEGKTVGCLQKESVALSQGNGSSGVILEESDKAGVLEWMADIRSKNGFRVNWDLFKYYAFHSGETLCWLDKIAEEAGYPADSHTTAHSVQHADGTRCAIASHGFGVKPESNHQLIMAMAELAAKKGAEFFYNCPGVQLIQDETGAVKGVIGKTEEGYIKFNANIAVIMATGDYQNNYSLVDKYCPDVSRFARKMYNRTGDGHLMAIMAGGRMVNVGHAKQAHDGDAAGNGFASIPLMALDQSGNRFMNEQLAMPNWVQPLHYLDFEDPGYFYRLFDSKYQEYYPKAPKPEEMQKFIPGAVENPVGVFPTLIDTHCCDTLEQLAEELGVDYAAMKASIDRWNELCDLGVDEDFGLAASNLHKIEEPPFWGIRQWVRITTINSGIQVDKNYQAVDANNDPIPGLFVVGTNGGDLCGNVDWSMSSGVSCGHCFTSGRYAALYACTGGYTPSNPGSWDEVKDMYTDPVNDTCWSWQQK